MSSLVLLIALLFGNTFAQDAVRRAEVEEESIFMTQRAIDEIEAKIKIQLSASMAKLSMDTVASSVQSAIDSSFAFVEPLQNKTDALNSQLQSVSISLANIRSEITSSVNTKISDFKNDIEDQIDDFKESTESEIQKSLERVDGSLETINKSIGKVRTDADNLACGSSTKGVLRLKDENLEACDGSSWYALGGRSRHYYTQWGNSDCTGNGAKKIFSGYAWGFNRDHYNGGEPVCLKSGGGDNGGNHDGDDSANLLYVLQTSGSSVGSPGHVGTSDNIKCAQCVVENSCYLEQSLRECPSGFKAMYSGALYGNHYSHQSQNSRICLDRGGDWQHHGSYGAYIYPSRLDESFDGRSSDSQLHCHVCCEE